MRECVVRRPVSRGARLLVAAVLGVAGCGSDSEQNVTSNSASTTPESSLVVTAEDSPAPTQVIDDDVATSATPGDPTDARAEPETETLSADQADAAIDIARAYFVAKTEFTSDQFEWVLETAVRDDEGRWWARVSAAPTSDSSLETEQIFVYNEADGAFWFALDMGTGIEPATDERFPEDVRDQL